LGTPEKGKSTAAQLVSVIKTRKLATNKAIDDCYNCQTLQIYRKHHNGQISIEEFHVPFGGTLDPENRWVLFSSLQFIEG